MPTVTLCALPGCTNPIILGRMPFKIGGHEPEYCSRGCVNIAFELMRKGKKFAKAQVEKVDYVKQDEKEEARARASPSPKETEVKVAAEEFGSAGVYRRYCDACGNPITVCWKGKRGGEYCSRNCQLTEKENTNMTTEDTTETTEQSPIAAGSPASKKGKKAVAKKAAAKKAAPVAAKKAAAPEASSNGAGRTGAYDNDAIIKVKKTDHGLKGKRAIAMDCLKDGMTVGKLKEVLDKKGQRDFAGFVLKTGVATGLISVK